MLEVIKSRAYAKWFNGMRNRMAKARIDKQVMRTQMAGRLMGDWKHVGDGVIKQRLDFGPGYRIYLSIEGTRSCSCSLVGRNTASSGT